MSYMAWRVRNGLHEDIELNFLIAGHTKFTPDLCFGLIKKSFRRTAISSLDEIAKVIQITKISHVFRQQQTDRTNEFTPAYNQYVQTHIHAQHCMSDISHPSTGGR